MVTQRSIRPCTPQLQPANFNVFTAAVFTISSLHSSHSSGVIFPETQESGLEKRGSVDRPERQSWLSEGSRPPDRGMRQPGGVTDDNRNFICIHWCYPATKTLPLFTAVHGSSKFSKSSLDTPRRASPACSLSSNRNEAFHQRVLRKVTTEILLYPILDSNSLDNVDKLPVGSWLGERNWKY